MAPRGPADIYCHERELHAGGVWRWSLIIKNKFHVRGVHFCALEFIIAFVEKVRVIKHCVLCGMLTSVL